MEPSGQYVNRMMSFVREAQAQEYHNNLPVFLEPVTKEAEYQIFHWLRNHGRQSWGWWN